MCTKPQACGVEASRCARKASETHEALPMGQTQGWALRVLFSGLFSYFKKITAWGSSCKLPQILNGMRLGTHLCTHKI